MPIFNMTGGGGTSLKCETGTIYVNGKIFKVNTTLKKITHYSFIGVNTDYHGWPYIAVSDGKSWHNMNDGATFSDKDVISTSIENGVFTLKLSGYNGTGYYFYYILIGE